MPVLATTKAVETEIPEERSCYECNECIREDEKCRSSLSTENKIDYANCVTSMQNFFILKWKGLEVKSILHLVYTHYSPHKGKGTSLRNGWPSVCDSNGKYGSEKSCHYRKQKSYQKVIWSCPRDTGTCLKSLLGIKRNQFSSVAQSCATPCDPTNHSTPGLPVHHKLPEFAQTHAHRVGDAIQPSHRLLSPSPPAPNPSQHQGLFQWVNSSLEVAKVLEFQLQHQSFQWTPRTDLL